MKEYRVEARTFYSKATFNKDHIAETSQENVQAILDECAASGWELASTNAASFGAAVYVYLYFEREI